MYRLLLFLLSLTLLSGLAFAQGGVRQKQVKPYEYGTITISNYAQKDGLGPVVFEHWVHRSKFTCRLCHVDLGFTMKAGGSEIKADDNNRGYFCGSCHNGNRSQTARCCSRRASRTRPLKTSGTAASAIKKKNRRIGQTFFSNLPQRCRVNALATA